MAAKRQPRFPADALPPEIAQTVRAVAKAERTTFAQAAIAALVVISDVMPPASIDLGDGEIVRLDEPIDIDLLTTGQADRRAVLRAYRVFINDLPAEGRARAASCWLQRERAAGTVRLIPRAEAVSEIAPHVERKRDYIVAAGREQAVIALGRLAGIRQCTAYIDQGEEYVTAAKGDALDIMTELMDGDDLDELASVIVIPKTISVTRLSRVLHHEIPADRSKDMIMLQGAEGMSFPAILVDAIGQFDPEMAGNIRLQARDHLLSQRSPAAVALVDQADAAGEEGLARMRAMVDHHGGEVEMVSVPPPAVREIIARLTDLAQAGGIGICPHVSTTSPAPAFWTPSAPEEIKCGACQAEVGRAMIGTPEDTACDNCRRQSKRIFNGATMFPPMVADLPGLLVAAGPLMVMYGLCPECHDREEEAS